MFTPEEQEKLRAISHDEELIPFRLRDHSLPLIAEVLENGRSQRFLGATPLTAPEGTDEKELSNTVRELRWEGFVDIEKDDIDDDGILDSIQETGWKTNDSGLEFLRRLKEAAGFE
ncbi:MAG: hypothetical protein J4G05_01000 [Chlorobi bacterium]|nr:hypothetical protein [Chlorobiota bacterium]